MNKRIKILLFEHDESDIGLILNELKKGNLNFIHEAVSTKIEFEKSLVNFAPDIVLSDYKFPAYDGLAAFNLKEKICPQVPFIIVSGIIGEEIAVELIKKGVTDFVNKQNLLHLSGKIIRALKEAEVQRDKNITEKELVESEKRLAEAQSIAKIGNWEVDLQTGTEYWSDEVYNILGIAPGELAPSKENFLSFVHPEERKDIEKIVVEAERNQKTFRYSTRIIRRDGTIRYIFSNGKHVFGKDGKAIRQIGILQDVTETKKMEEELKAMNKELETFIYRASHDLRGPLSSIIGLTNVSKSEIKDETAKKYFQMVEASAQKLDSTLISLVQSMTMRDMVVDMQDIDFDELVHEILSQLTYHEGFSKIEITYTNEIGKKYRSNKLIMTSVFQNFIQNAIKYQDYHNGAAYLRITIRRKDKGIEIIFDDNGIGIEEHMQGKIFDMYFRGTESVSGSGLGLYIVKIGIEKLKGTIQLKSTKGKGTCFTVYLPDPG